MKEYLLRLDDWVRSFGKAVVTFNVTDVHPYDDKPDLVGPDTLWIGSFDVRPDLDCHHAIVMQGRRPRWDPETGTEWPPMRAPLKCAIFLVGRT
jgi:hypothetical protein